MEAYNKPPLTYEEQINLLKSRGLIFSEEEKYNALKYLPNISYYRLSAYMLPYKKKNSKGEIIDEFKDNTTWTTIYNLYKFDRKLRLLIFDAIERIEIAIRSQIIYQLSHKYGSHWQDRREIFKQPETKTSRDGKRIFTVDVYSDIQQQIKEQLDISQEMFIKHYKQKYNNPVNPPSWMSIEIMYFNHLSRICSGLKNRSDLVGIAKYFDLPPKTFCSWLHTINYVRNLCAHHSRLWNREFNIVPEKLEFSKNLIWVNNPHNIKRSKPYYFFCMIVYLLQTINPTSKFKERLKNLLLEYNDVVSLESMGFSKNWKEEYIWN
ncbi:MAG: Abi family protein [Bacteroidales bacterium]|nr:Abi family protein [Bacteroidales bacterium]